MSGHFQTRNRENYAETLPIKDLPRAAIQWLDAISRDEDPLLLSFGFDALDFFFQLITGRHGYGDGPDLKPIVEIQPPLERGQ